MKHTKNVLSLMHNRKTLTLRRQRRNYAGLREFGVGRIPKKRGVEGNNNVAVVHPLTWFACENWKNFKFPISLRVKIEAIGAKSEHDDIKNNSHEFFHYQF
jgi:hypothetical protein